MTDCQEVVGLKYELFAYGMTCCQKAAGLQYDQLSTSCRPDWLSTSCKPTVWLLTSYSMISDCEQAVGLQYDWVWRCSSDTVWPVPLITESILLAADVLPKITALPRSCVVIPCSFRPQDHLTTGLRGVWYNRDGGRVYHGGQSQVLSHFKGRTKLLGDVRHSNCTLEIDDIKPFDNGPFCFRAEKGAAKYSFNDSCVFIVMQGIQPFLYVVRPGTSNIVLCVASDPRYLCCIQGMG